MGNLLVEDAGEAKWLWDKSDRWSPALLREKRIEYAGYEHFSNARWSVPLKELPNTYFEVTVISMTSRSAVVVGACTQACGKLGLNLNGLNFTEQGYQDPSGGCWIVDRQNQPRNPYERIQRGDVIGWGIAKDAQLFWTYNGKIFYEDFLPNEFYTLYPTVSARNKCSLEINLDSKNPSEAGPYVAGPTSNKKSVELMGRPLGQLDYTFVSPDALLCRLPLDILLAIQRLLGSLCPVLLSVCKSLHQPLFPTFKWLDYHTIRDRIPGFYVHNEFLEAYEDDQQCFTLAYELKADGTFEGVSRVCRDDGHVFKRRVQGVWVLSHLQVAYVKTSYNEKGQLRPATAIEFLPLNQTGTGKREPVIQFSSEEGFILRNIKVNPHIPSGITYIQLYQHAKLLLSRKDFEAMYLRTGKEDDDTLSEDIRPQRHCVIRRCGVPPNQRNADEGCCSEVVKGLMESIWNESYDYLGSEAKQDIIARVSLNCMEQPGGMTDNQIKLAIAAEVCEFLPIWSAAQDPIGLGHKRIILPRS